LNESSFSTGFRPMLNFRWVHADPRSSYPKTEVTGIRTSWVCDKSEDCSGNRRTGSSSGDQSGYRSRYPPAWTWPAWRRSSGHWDSAGHSRCRKRSRRSGMFASR